MYGQWKEFTPIWIQDELWKQRVCTMTMKSLKVFTGLERSWFPPINRQDKGANQSSQKWTMKSISHFNMEDYYNSLWFAYQINRNNGNKIRGQWYSLESESFTKLGILKLIPVLAPSEVVGRILELIGNSEQWNILNTQRSWVEIVPRCPFFFLFWTMADIHEESVYEIM